MEGEGEGGKGRKKKKEILANNMRGAEGESDDACLCVQYVY